MKKIVFLLSAAFICSLNGFFKEDFATPDSRKNLLDKVGIPENYVVEQGILTFKTEKKHSFGRLHLYKAGTPADVDASFKIRFKNPQGGYAGIILRRTKTDCGVGVSLTASQTHLLYQGPNNRAPEYFQIKAEKGSWHTIRVVLNGSKGRIYFNGKAIFDLDNLPEYGGDVLLRTWESHVEFDDIELKNSLPPDTRNLAVNGSFEYDGTAKGIPAGWGIGGWGLVNEEIIANLDKFNNQWGRTTENPAHGKYCMKVAMHDLFSSYFAAQPQQQYTMSAMVRADKPGRMRMLFIPWRAPEGDKLTEKYFNVTTQWQKISWQLPKTGASQFGIYFYRPENSTLFVDAVSITAGTTVPDTYIVDYYRPDKKNDHYANAVKLVAGKLPSVPLMKDALDSPVWKNGADFKMSGINGGTPKNTTYGKIGYDNNNIYIKCICEDPSPEKIVANVKKRDGHVWNDDCIELFIGPSGPRGDWADYFHLGVSASGAQYDARKIDPSWDKNWKAESRRTAKGYEIMITLPFEMFELNSFNLNDWTFNICRESPANGENSAWSPTYGSFHNQEKFGLLSIPSDVLAKHISNDSNSPSGKSAAPTGVAMLNGEMFFPFGLCWSSSAPGCEYPGENAFKAIAEMDCNTIQWQVLIDRTPVEKVREVLDLAQKYNIKMNLWLDPCFANHTPLYSPEAVELMRKYITALHNHEAIASWMVFDEPHEHGEFVRKSTEELKKLSPDKPLFINVTPHGLGMKIAGLPGDILAFDRYAFGFDGSTINDIGVTAKSAASAANGRPVWCFLMTGGNVLWMQNSASAEENICQYYTALTNGVTGIIGFTNVPPSPDTRSSIKKIANEFKEILPELYSGTPCDVSVNGKVSFIAREKDNVITLVAVNSSESPVKAEFILPYNIKNIFEKFQKGTNFIKNNKLSVDFNGLERKVFIIGVEK